MSHPVFARIYARRSAADDHLQVHHRQALLAGLSGRVLELGCGNGLNFSHYPPAVTEVVGVEPEEYLRRRALLAASREDRRIVVLEGTAETVADVVRGTFDAAVFSLVLCTVSAPRAVLRGTRGVLREGAPVRVYEHVVSDNPRAARVQRLFGPMWSRLAGGCRPDRDTLALLEEELLVSEVRTFDLCTGPRFPCGIAAPHLLARGVFRPA